VALLDLTIEHDVAVLVLCDIARRYALTRELVDAINDAVSSAEGSASALVIAAEGPAFCAGAPRDTLDAASLGDFAGVENVYRAFLAVLHTPLLTVAAVQGPAIGAGMNLALACDIRIAGPRATFDPRFSALHLHPGGGHLWLLRRAVGYQRAALATICAESWDADTASRDGLVARVDEDPIETAVALARRATAVERDLLLRMVSSLRATEGALHNEAFALEAVAQEWSTTRPGLRQVLSGDGSRRPSPH
jgi:enoyl-CoA hydratase